MTDQLKRGPAWYDVHQALGKVENTYGVRLRFELGRQRATKQSDQCLSVALVVTSAPPGTAAIELPVLWSIWPHVDHKTMPGLMLKLLHITTDRLEEARETDEKRRQGELPA